ncbi:MAG: M28 family peptidase [Chitinophagaceae bacterium]|nr:MAG: M28 family peptidase [Chitinophagaceae bacterium]
MRKSFLLLLLAAQSALAQNGNPPGLSAITEASLRSDLFALADSHFHGRSAGTPDELRAAAWQAERLRKIGARPAGDDGTYFQYFTMWRNEYAPASSVQLNGRHLAFWSEVMPAQLTAANLEAPLLYLGPARRIDTARTDIAGKIVVVEADATGLNLDVSLPTWRYPRLVYARYGAPLVRRGAAAVIFVADAMGERSWADAAENYRRGSYDIEGGPNATVAPQAPVLWVRSGLRAELQRDGAQARINLAIVRYAYPSVNVVAAIDGTDPKLKGEYLLYSGHTDAHGIRNPINGDSIYYGADDNASVNVAIFACARAFAGNRPRRSVLVVIHGAEERGLLGSRYFVAHPTVPLRSIVSVLNGDMIGRNHQDSAAILGSTAPHRNSRQLVQWALDANREGPAFRLDTLWDKPAHVEGWYFRSDHLPYARLGIPALMYTTLLHPDYHTPLDNAQRIDYKKLKKMTEWMYRTGWKVANAPHRPERDADFKLER